LGGARAQGVRRDCEKVGVEVMGECRDIGELERLISMKFEHLERLIMDALEKNAKEHEHFQNNFRELYNEHKKLRDESALGDQKTLTEVDAKMESVSNRISRLEEAVTRTRTELEVREKTGKSFMGLVALGITALTFLINFIFRG
jgi:chromosome segregation ATPase